MSEQGHELSFVPVQVFVRVRPLIDEENGHALLEYKLIKDGVCVESTATPSTSIQLTMPSKNRVLNPTFQTRAPPPKLRRPWRDEHKLFHGFTRVLEPDTTNEEVYLTTMKPLMRSVSTEGHSACVFTYGHTGSGKTHTLLGYKGKSLGIYEYAAREIFSHLAEFNNGIVVESKKRVLLVRITELYKDTVKDCLTGDDTCSIRQGNEGVVHVRGPMIADDEGRIDQRPLGQLCKSTQDILDCVDKAVECRRVGVSTHHDKSSRSHLVMEFEVVTAELVELRNRCLKEVTQLHRLKWLQIERMFDKGHELPKWTGVYNDRMLHEDISKWERVTKDGQESLSALEADVGGATLVVCDLAGNEYASDSGGSTKQERDESAEINKSLLAVKEMIRAMNNPINATTHVPYRNSKLSMLLKRHLEGRNSRAVMIAHISSSQENFKKTINTLTYTSMMGCSSAKIKQTNKETRKNKKVAENCGNGQNITGIQNDTKENTADMS